MTEPRRINLEQLLTAEGDDLISARGRGATYHATRDIRAAGNEVEIEVRQLMSRHMPTAYGVGHGHVVDSQMRTSGQFDVIIYDAMSSAMVSQAADGTGYYPYESVLAVGEVKTSYRRHEHPIVGYSEKIRELRGLNRDRPGGQSALVRHGFGTGITLPTTWPYHNRCFRSRSAWNPATSTSVSLSGSRRKFPGSTARASYACLTSA